LITLFCVRPKRFNVGNEAIFVGVRHLLRDTFGGLVNIVQVPAIESAEDGALSGLLPKTVHEMNLYGHGVVVGGGNLYENGQLAVDRHALTALRPPLMLFSISHGRIYDNRHQLVRRSDSMSDVTISALHAQAAISVARDEATIEHLRAIGAEHAIMGGCPTLLLSQVELPRLQLGAQAGKGALLSIRNPQLMSIPLRDQARLHDTVTGIIAGLEADGYGPVRVLCHDTRDLTFASSLGDVEYVLPDDVYSYLELLRGAPLVVSFRLHAFLPALSFGTPAINISYDERSSNLVKTIGMGAWDIDYVRSPDVVAQVRDRVTRLAELDSIREAAQPVWQNLERVMRGSMAEFATLVTAYAAERPPLDD
jgi:hypothetical protein